MEEWKTARVRIGSQPTFRSEDEIELHPVK
jgi:hypothetical protein